MQTKPATEEWGTANQRYLMSAIAGIRAALQQENRPTPALWEHETPSGLDKVCHVFRLSPFERDILLLCAGLELAADWGALCAEAQGNPQCPYPTFGLALAILPNVDWSALLPTAPLRRWRLIELGGSNALTNAPLRIDERILHEITGFGHLDERLLGLAEPVLSARELVASHHQLAEQIAQTWLQASGNQLPLVQLCGTDSASKAAIAASACAWVGVQLYCLSAEFLPTEVSQLHLMQCLCEREWVLNHTTFLIDCEHQETTETSKNSQTSHFIEAVNLPLLISTPVRRRQRQRSLITIDVYSPTNQEQRLLWENALGKIDIHLNGQVEHLVSHFNLTVPQIESACLKVKAQQDTDFHHLWDVCRTQARPRLDELAQRIDVSGSWEDLVLPDKEKAVLQEVAAHVRQRARVYEQWGFAGKSGRGLGISALFAGASGTGKTMAAEAIAQELQLDLYRIDLSSIVSKYIGETEKNLRQVFDAAEGGGVILLFDEADALFGKRSEVKDSHDRHANIEVSYLLQRMETYRGLAILTTNLKSSLDQAFLRRIRFVIQFPFPDAVQRAEIWQRIFPQQAPIHELDYKKLAKLSVAGGNIRNIALNAAFIAADAGEAVGMPHILEAAKSEYMKLERPLTDAEVKGWV